ncbi:MAG: SRPBCC family protein [Solirubrobacteraceae bacterium]
MLLLGPRPQRLPDREVWTARADLDAEVSEVLEALTDPVLIAQWAPVDFDVDGLAGGGLRTGSRARVSGTIGGLRVTFEVDVARADERRLELVARGPVSIEVVYSLCDRGSGVTVEARVALPPQRGLTAQVLRAAASALLNHGALAGALRRLDGSLSRSADDRLVAV